MGYRRAFLTGLVPMMATSDAREELCQCPDNAARTLSDSDEAIMAMAAIL